MPGRKYDAGNGYRYGFNGKEGDGNIANDDYDFGARIYDARLGRWMSVDPRWSQFPEWSPYNYALDNPIRLIDNDGEGPIEPLHHLFLTSIAIDIYDAAKANGASGKGALLIMAQASIESGYGQDAIKRGDYNLFGVMTLGNDYKAKTSHGRIKDYSNNGQYSGSIKDYFDGKNRKWPLSADLIKKDNFTADEVDASFYTGKYFETKKIRNKTGHLSYNMDGISSDEKINNNKYGSTLIAQMNDLKARLITSIDYQSKLNTARIDQIDKELAQLPSQMFDFSKIDYSKPFALPGSPTQKKISDLNAEKDKLKAQNNKLAAVKKDISN